MRAGPRQACRDWLTQEGLGLAKANREGLPGSERRMGRQRALWGTWRAGWADGFCWKSLNPGDARGFTGLGPTAALPAWELTSGAGKRPLPSKHTPDGLRGPGFPNPPQPLHLLRDEGQVDVQWGLKIKGASPSTCCFSDPQLKTTALPRGGPAQVPCWCLYPVWGVGT